MNLEDDISYKFIVLNLNPIDQKNVYKHYEMERVTYTSFLVTLIKIM
jgi:hypothetical protein